MSAAMELAGIPGLRDDEYALFQALIRREAGIALGPQKRPLIIARLLPRLRALGLRTFAEYYQQVIREEGGLELQRMIDCICTNETRFFREPAQFELLRSTLIPAFRAALPRPIRVWSAACSTGEEPYSAAMTLLHGLPRSGFPIQIVATDLSTRALERAQRAIWPIDQAAEIPSEYLNAFMLRGKGAQRGNMKAGPELRALVSFRRHNLIAAAPPALGLFDLILCRNVLIYFDAATRALVVSRLLDSLRPRGFLFLGHAEGLGPMSSQMETVMPAVYRRTS
jgi:chemotaxis protein methyltransferase CheR